MTEAEDGLSKRVMAIVAHHRGVPASQLTLLTDVYKDLGCSGDDVDDLFLDLENRFGIDFSGFQFDRHFGAEGTPLWGWQFDEIVWFLGLVAVAVAVGINVEGWWGPLPGPITFVGFVFLAGAWGYLGSRILPSSRNWERERIPVTVGNLIEAARTKAWPIKYESNVK